MKENFFFVFCKFFPIFLSFASRGIISGTCTGRKAKRVLSLKFFHLLLPFTYLRQTASRAFLAGNGLKLSLFPVRYDFLSSGKKVSLTFFAMPYKKTSQYQSIDRRSSFGTQKKESSSSPLG